MSDVVIDAGPIIHLSQLKLFNLPRDQTIRGYLESFTINDLCVSNPASCKNGKGQSAQQGFEWRFFIILWNTGDFT